MNNKLRITFASLAGLTFIGTSTVVARGLIQNPEIILLQRSMDANDFHIQGKAAGLQALEEEEARTRATQEISEQQVKTIIQEKEVGHQERMRGIAAQKPSEKGLNQSPFIGIIEGGRVPVPFQSNEFKVVNFWGDVVDGKSVGVYAGYRPDDPSQGAVVIYDNQDDVQGSIYPAPKSTGPLSVTAEKNGMLTLTSLNGEFEVYDTHPVKRIRVPGSATYRFNLRSRLFE